MLGSLLLAAALSAAPSAPVALDSKSQALIARPEYEHVVISPDGNLLAVTRHDPQGTFVLILKSSDQSLVKMIDTGIKAEVPMLAWTDSSHLVVEMSRILGAEVAETRGSYLYLFSVKDALPVQMPAAYMGRIDGDNKHILVAYCKRRAPQLPCTVEATRLDIDDVDHAKEKVAEAPIDYARLMSDHAGNVRFAWAKDENDNNRFYVTGNGKDWTLLNDEQKSGVSIWPEGIARDNKSAYFIVEHKDGLNSVERYDFATGTRTLLWRDANSDALTFLRALDLHDIVGAEYGLGRPQAVFWDPSSQDAKLSMAIVKAFPDAMTFITSASDDGSMVVVKTVSDRDPGTFYLIDMVHHKAKFLLRSRPLIDPKQQLASEPFNMKARDGLELTGFVTRPTASAAPSPMIVLVHGGPFEERDSWEFDPEAQLLAQHGYAVLRVNYRGSAAQGRAFRERSFMQWGGAVQDDVTDATRWAITQGIADPKRICIYGANFGGYSALMGVVREPGLYQCAAGRAGPYDLSKLYTWNDYLNHYYYQSHVWEHYLQRAIGQDDKQLADRSPITHAAEIKVPVFLAHGHKDLNVDVRHSEAMRDALAKAGHPPEYVEYPLEFQGLFDPADRLDFYTRLVNFFDASLAPGAVKTADSAVNASPQVASP